MFTDLPQQLGWLWELPVLWGLREEVLSQLSNSERARGKEELCTAGAKWLRTKPVLSVQLSAPQRALIVEIRPLSSVPCVYSPCIKEAFISLEQIINTFHQRCEGGDLALKEKNNHTIIKSCPKRELRETNLKVPIFNDSDWPDAKVLVPRGAWLADSSSAGWPFWAQEFSIRRLAAWEARAFAGSAGWGAHSQLPSVLAGLWVLLAE